MNIGQTFDKLIERLAELVEPSDKHDLTLAELSKLLQKLKSASDEYNGRVLEEAFTLIESKGFEWPTQDREKIGTGKKTLTIGLRRSEAVLTTAMREQTRLVQLINAV